MPSSAGDASSRCSGRTWRARHCRGVEGFSMGGFGAAHLGFKFPDLFGVISIKARVSGQFDLALEGRHTVRTTCLSKPILMLEKPCQSAFPFRSLPATQEGAYGLRNFRRG